MDLANMLDFGLDFGLRLLGAVALLLAGWLVASWADRGLRRLGRSNANVDTTLANAFGRVARVAVMLITLIAVLDRFGVQTASLLAVLGTAGLAIGLALQGTLANVAAGVMVLVLRPIRVGESVDVAGTSGVVEDVGLFVTNLRSFDGVPITMPNGRIWGAEIRNFTRAQRRRADIRVGIAYGDSMPRAMALVQALLAADARVLQDPAPLVKVDALGESSVDLLVRYWTLPSDFLVARMDLTQAIKERFDAEGITIPFPQRELHVITRAGD